MAREKNKDAGKPKPKPKVKKPKSSLTPDQQARFGVSGPVSSSEMERIKRATDERNRILSEGGEYYSIYDTAKNDTEGKGFGVGEREIGGNPPFSGSGGSGGTGNLDAYTRLLQKMYNESQYADPYEELRTGLEGLYGEAQTGLQGQYDESTAKLKELMGGAGTQINTAMDQLQSILQQQQNPYQGFVAQQAQAVPGLNELLGSQAVSTDPVAKMASALNAGNAGQAAAFQNLANTMGTMYGANQQGMLGDVAQQRASAQTGLANQGAAYGQDLSRSFKSDTNALAKQLLGEKSGLARDSASAGEDLLKQILAMIQGGGRLGKGGLRTGSRKPAVRAPGVVARPQYAIDPNIDLSGLDLSGMGSL